MGDVPVPPEADPAEPPLPVDVTAVSPGESDSSCSRGHVRVVLRVRPLIRREYGYPLAAEKQSHTRHVRLPPAASQPTLCCSPSHFSLSTHTRLRLKNGKSDIVAGADVVLDDTATQEDVYAHVADVVAGCLQGQNGTVFAYGQTSTGKTHTMLGRETPASQPGQPPFYAVTGPPRGVVPRAVEALMQGAQAAEMTGWATQLTAMYIQQYGERLYDLLQPLPSAHQPWARDVAGVKALSGLELRPLPGGAGVSVAGARRVELTSVEVLSDLLAAGAANRAFRATGMNASSSRSHAILQVAVRQTHRTTGAQRDAKLNLVDLAGSEKWSLEEIGPGVPPERIAELCAINASLSSLGACVRALGDPLRPHVPYRDSKLTRLLQDALGGAAQTVLLATLSPSLLSFEESASTVRFADAASRILVTQRHVVTAEDVDPVAQAAAARAEVARLQTLLRSLTSAEEPSAASKLEAENIRLKKELADAKSKAAAAQRAALRAAEHVVRPSAGDGVASPPLNSAAAPAASPGYASAPRQPASSGSGGKGTHIRVAAPLRRPGPASPPAPAQPAAAVAGDTQRLSDGWTEPCDATPPRKPPTHRKPPPASPEWLAGYAAQKKAATEAAAAARAAAAEGTFDTRLRRKAGVQPAAWEQGRFYSRPGGTATSPLQGAQRPRSEQAKRRGRSPVASAERIPATHLLAMPATPPEAATRQRDSVQSGGDGSAAGAHGGGHELDAASMP